MNPRHEQRDRLFSDTTPFFTYRRGAVVPDQSKGRTPIGTMTNAEIYGPALDTMPACSGDCGQGNTQCPHPGQCQADTKALRRLAGLCVAVWGLVGVLVYLLVQAL